MQHPQIPNPTPNHVRAVFASSPAFFDLSGVVTFEQLANRLCSLSERHGGPPTSIELVTERSIDGSDVRSALIRQLTALED